MHLNAKADQIQDGYLIKAQYLGSPVSGIVCGVQYSSGGHVKYTVKLASPVHLSGQKTAAPGMIMISADDVTAAYGPEDYSPYSTINS